VSATAGTALKGCVRGRTRELTVPIITEAVYENGVLKPIAPLPLREHETVEVTIRTKVSVARQTAGMIPWTGDAQTLERIADDPEFGILESP
jgi:predicted DNA-binding antitoxin AbrB/MazE fold protein